MRATQHPSNTRVLGAPIGWDQKELPCNALPITDGEQSGLHTISSFWKPTEEELAHLAAGGLVELVLVGTQHPAVALQVTPPAP